MLRRAELRGVARTYVPDVRETVQDLLFRAAIGAIVGMRMFYVLTHLDQYARDPLAIFKLWEGGMTFLGGVAGALVAALPAARRRGYRVLQLFDSAAPGMAIGLFIGRIGDLLIGDHIGDPGPTFPLAWRCSGNFWHAETNRLSFADPVPPQPYPFVDASAPTQGCFDAALHQTALYDFVQAGLLLGLLVYLERRPRWDGFFIAVALYWYGAIRFLTDFLREDRRLLGLTGSQYAFLVTLVAVAVLLVVTRPWRNHPWAWQPPDFDLPWKHPPAHAVERGSVRSDEN